MAVTQSNDIILCNRYKVMYIQPKISIFQIFFLINFYETFSSHKLYSHGYGVT